MKQKILDIQYSKLQMQEYLADRNTDISKLIFKASGKTLDIKFHKKWKYDHILCSWTDDNLMQINEEKSKYMIVNFTEKY